MTDTVLALDGIEKRFGDTVTAAGISLELARSEFFTLLGPSGSGKSTILRIIAGLENPDGGTVRLDGADITRLPPWRRGLGMVFQQYANFPHMSVAGNVAYGLRRAGFSKHGQNARVRELLELVGLGGFEGRPVTQLSGGEQQRVAIARALAPGPEILLLDEPLSALDEKIRREMQDELRRIQRDTGTTFVYVTHDQEEALTMSDRISVLNEGHMVQCDAPEAIFQRPQTRFVARFFRGCNVLDAALENEDGQAYARFHETRVAVGTRIENARSFAGIAIRAENVHIGPDAEGRRIRMDARLDERVYRGLYTDYRFVLPDGQHLSAMTAREAGIEPGETVTVGVDEGDIVLLTTA